jgi:AcrR family transcriptional regulator
LRLWDEGDFDEAYEASTAADIASAAGVSKGTFYFHFPNKEAILVEMGSSTVRAMIDEVEAKAGADLPLRAMSDQVMTLMSRRVARGPRAAALRAASLGLSVGGKPVDAEPRLSAAFVTLLQYGVQRGELGPVDVDDAAAMLTVVTMEAIIRWGEGTRSTRWLSNTMRARAGVVLRGLGLADQV